MHFTETQIKQEAQRLFQKLGTLDCDPRRKQPWTIAEFENLAPLTLEINALKAERKATIMAHSYVDPEIIYAVADHVGDSYYLSVMAQKNKSSLVIFAGVIFMAESTKLLSPNSRVYVPDLRSGCSLADSLTGAQLRELKKQYPNAATVSYVNCNADVKAESDVCVTSTNVYDIVSKLPQKEILFVPDRLMAENIRVDLRARGIDKIIYTSDGTCEVHDRFTSEIIHDARKKFSNLKVVSHPECTLDITQNSDFVGSTSAMMKYVKETEADYFMILSECGLVSRLEVEAPEKRFVASCKLCPYMKLNTLEKIRDTLRDLPAEQEITVPEPTLSLGVKALERMIELTETK
jgi:quinolinate synthase